MLFAIAALLEANSSLSGVYDNVLSSDFAVTLNGVVLQKPPIVWMNDGLMAISDLLAPQQRPRATKPALFGSAQGYPRPLWGYSCLVRKLL